MSTTRYRSPFRVGICLALAVAGACGLPPGAARTQQPPGDKDKDKGRPPVKIENRVFSLRYVDAHELARTLQGLLGKIDTTIVAEPTANRLIVRGTSAMLTEIQQLIKQLDVESAVADAKPRLQLHMYALKKTEPDANL